MLCAQQKEKDHFMIGQQIQPKLAMAFAFAVIGSFAVAQTSTDPGRFGAWDPITGLADGNAPAYPGASSSSGNRGSSSVWSGYRVDPDVNSQPAATFGAIVITGEGRRCGGLFRSVAC